MLAAPPYDDFAYQRRDPERGLLHRVLLEHLETFLDRARTETHGLPQYVVKELRGYLECGVLGHGFVRVKCADCQTERIVAFRIDVEKCPECSGKMKIVAALTDPASVRQYLKGTGNEADIPELAPARAPPQVEMDLNF